MDIKRILTPLLLALLPLQGVFAAVTLTETGAFTSSVFGDCPAPCTLIDQLVADLGPTTGSTGILSTSSSLSGLSIGDGGTLFAEATILGGLATPSLRASAESVVGKWIGINATGIQGYTVTGGGNGQTLNAMVTLSGTVTNPDSTFLTELSAAAVFVSGGDLIGFTAETAALQLLAPDVALTKAAGESDKMGTMMLTVDEGDQFYLVANLGASAEGANASAISLSTLSIAFDAPSAAVLSPAAVPLPATVILLAPLLGLLAVRRQT